MISKLYLNERKKVFGNKPWEIEGFEEAISSEEMYVPHHVLEWKYTIDELKSMGHYDKVSPEELIWMPRSVHSTNKWLHKGITFKHLKGNTCTKGRKITHKPRTEFNKRFREHYSMVMSDNPKLYESERTYFRKYGKCSWEV